MDFFNDHAVAFALVCAGVAVGFVMSDGSAPEGPSEGETRNCLSASMPA